MHVDHFKIKFNVEYYIININKRYVSEKNAEVVECVKSNWINETLKLEKFAKDDIDFTSSSSSDKYLEEYFELKSKYENTKKINNKIYNFAIEKILNKNN